MNSLALSPPGKRRLRFLAGDEGARVNGPLGGRMCDLVAGAVSDLTALHTYADYANYVVWA